MERTSPRRIGLAGLVLVVAGALPVLTVIDTVSPVAAGAVAPPAPPTGPSQAADDPAPAPTQADAAGDRGGPPAEHPGKGRGKPTPPDDPQEPEEPADPAFTVPQADLDAALVCSDLQDAVGADREAVLLVHGTGTWGEEEYAWSWLPTLEERGYDWCVVTYPDRGFGDLQTSAEYVANALLTMHEQTGRPVDMAGHSQGGLMPRWALKYWPSANAATDDFVMLAAPNHGTAVAGSGPVPTGMPEAFWQMRQGSAFVTTLNAGGESPGDVSYTSIYAVTDELVQPSTGAGATAPLAEADNVANLDLQEACPGRVVDHLSIGTTDRAAFEFTLAAFAQPGPLDVTALDVPAICRAAPDEAAPLYDGLEEVDAATGLPVGGAVVTASGAVPEPFQRFASLPAAADLFVQEFERGGTWDWHVTRQEPPIRPYAQ